MDLAELAAGWPAATSATAVLGADGMTGSAGPDSNRFELASVTKLFTAWAVHVAIEEETLILDEPVTETGATVADLLAHASGLGPGGDQLSEPRTRRIYSNAGYELLASLVAERSSMGFGSYLGAAVFEPLGMNDTVLDGSAAHGATSTLHDCALFANEMLRPRLLAPATVERLRSPHMPDLAGILPGYGRQAPNPWGLGPEIRGHKQPHWTAHSNSPQTHGHFGQSGTFIWIDPAIDRACVVLTDEAFGPWAVEAWPVFSAAVVDDAMQVAR